MLYRKKIEREAEGEAVACGTYYPFLQTKEAGIVTEAATGRVNSYIVSPAQGRHSQHKLDDSFLYVSLHRHATGITTFTPVMVNGQMVMGAIDLMWISFNVRLKSDLERAEVRINSDKSDPIGIFEENASIETTLKMIDDAMTASGLIARIKMDDLLPPLELNSRF